MRANCEKLPWGLVPLRFLGQFFTRMVLAPRGSSGARLNAGSLAILW